MDHPFECLGLEPSLCLDDDALNAAFREAGRRAHPDAGGTEEAFERVRAAHAQLASPARRLRHWMDSRGLAVEARGVVEAGLMDLFGKVGEVTQRADALARKRAGARSALGLALLEGEAQRMLDEVAAVLSVVDAALARETAGFAAFERDPGVDAAVLSRCLRNLTFLEKWRHALRSIPPRLV